MASARTVKTLTALLAAMTVGAFVLMLMETAPIESASSSLSALSNSQRRVEELILATHEPAKLAKWRNIVLHSTGAEGNGIARRCHFLVDIGASGVGVIRPTPLWKQQLDGNHVDGLGRDFKADSIGICLLGDFALHPPRRALFQALMTLVRGLQNTFDIGAESVYLHSDLDAHSFSPGPAFPAKMLSDQLVH